MASSRNGTRGHDVRHAAMTSAKARLPVPFEEIKNEAVEAVAHPAGMRIGGGCSTIRQTGVGCGKGEVVPGCVVGG